MLTTAGIWQPSLAAWSTAAGAQLILCTHKDLVKFDRDQLGGRPLWAVVTETEFLAGQQRLIHLLDGLLGGSPRHPP